MANKTFLEMSNITPEQAAEMQDRVNRLKTVKYRAIITSHESHRSDDVTALDVHERLKTLHIEGVVENGRMVGAKPERETGAEMARPQQRNQALGRLPKGVMNKTEAAYARHLEALKFAGEILDYWFEEIKFKIGTSACWYEPDFLVQVKGGAMEIHECKGHWQEDALVKIKSLSLRYPFRVIAVRLIKGVWVVREFN